MKDGSDRVVMRLRLLVLVIQLAAGQFGKQSGIGRDLEDAGKP